MSVDTVTLDCMCSECLIACFLLQYAERPDAINKMQLVPSAELHGSWCEWLKLLEREPCSLVKFSTIVRQFGYRRRQSTIGKREMGFYFLELLTPRNELREQLEKHSDAREQAEGSNILR